MKKKPQIGYGVAWEPETRKVWTLNNKAISYELAREHWDACSADWSIPAHQAMADIVMAEGRRKLEP